MSSKREERFLQSALQYEGMEWSSILVGEEKKRHSCQISDKERGVDLDKTGIK